MELSLFFELKIFNSCPFSLQIVKDDNLVKNPLLRHSREGGNPECIETTRFPPPLE